MKLLTPLSLVYDLAARLRLSLYGTGFKKSHRASVPVISVGNMTVGGTGKTPVVIDLAKRFQARGFKPAVISRGYKRKSAKSALVVFDGEKFASVEESGDEPYLIAAATRGLVIVGADRIASQKKAVTEYGADLLILDDGFQHLPLARDLDIVLWDINDDPGSSLLLPAGRLREPLSALARAKLIVLTKGEDEALIESVSLKLRRYNSTAPICRCRFVPLSLSRLEGGSFVQGDLTEIAGKSVFVFSGIARPEQLLATVESLGAGISGKAQFPDHHWFSPADMDRLNRQVRQCGAEAFVTTEKDLVRLSNLKLDKPVLAVSLGVEWLPQYPSLLAGFLND